MIGCNRSQGFFWGAVGAILSLCFAYLCCTHYRVPVFEAGDGAANSLLVLKAKTLSLLVGNYSRLGFNHPGPAFIYVLAIGEWLFFDVLGIASAPIVGQGMGVSVFLGCWVAAVGLLFERFFGVRFVALVAVSVFCGVLIGHDWQVFGSMWFPYLYVLPFAAFVLSVALLLSGDYRVFSIFCMSIGMLIHGHAAFIVIVGLVVVLVVALRVFLFRSNWADVVTLGVEKDRLGIVGGLIILALFAAPIVFNSVVNFPGEFPRYFSYGRTAHLHSLIDGLSFMVMGIGGGVVALAGAIVVAISAGYGVGGGQKYPSRYLALTVLVVCMVVLIYVLRGVDDLGPTNFYTIYFFFSVLALVLALGGIVAIEGVFVSRGLRLIALAVVLAFAIVVIKKDARPTPLHEMAEVVDIARMMRSDGSGMFAIDLDRSGDFRDTWSGVGGIAVVLMRQGFRNFCINAGWDIAYTRDLQCSAEKYRAARRYVVGSRGGDLEGWPGVSAFGRLTVVKLPPITPMAGSGWRVSRAGEYALLQGWSPISTDTDYVWSVGSVASLGFWVAGSKVDSVVIDAGAFLPTESSVQRFNVFARDGRIAVGTFALRYGESAKPIRLRLPVGAIGSDGYLNLTIRVESPVSPKSAGLSDDDRALGLSLRSVSFD